MARWFRSEMTKNYPGKFSMQLFRNPIKYLRARGETFSVERAAEAYLALFCSLLSENA
jgi:hypothetical protein